MATGQFPNQGRFTRNWSIGNGSTRKRRIGTLYPTALGNEQYTAASVTANKLLIDYFWGITSPGSTGTLATTNANDTSTASGTTTPTGTLARTNANDSIVASGTTTPTGTLARTNANDTLAASGTAGATPTGTLATTNANDTLAASGTTTPTGTLAKTNANDTSAASGTTTITGTLARTNANDAPTASGTTTPTGTSSTTNAADSLSATGAAGSASGTANVTNANDTLSASGTGGTEVPYDGGTHSGYTRPRQQAPARKPSKVPVSLPLITGSAYAVTFPDTVEAFGTVDPFNILRDDEELLLLV